MNEIPGNFYNTSIGFESLFGKNLSNKSSFPFYNLIKTGEKTYSIELALAGYSIEDISIDLSNQVLSISSDRRDSNAADRYIYIGFAQRAFERIFTLRDDVVVNSAVMVDGVLKINLEQITLTSDSRKIKISSK